MTADEYRGLLQALLPRGAAWSRESEAILFKLLDGLAEELARTDDRSAQLVDEADARTSYELLADWERVTGLPDPCVGSVDSTLQDRRDSVRARLASVGGQSRAYFIARAAEIGHTITITETEVSIANVLHAGDELSASHSNRYAWQVDVPIQNTYTFVAGVSTPGDELGFWLPTRLECLFARMKPGHSIILWKYT